MNKSSGVFKSFSMQYAQQVLKNAFLRAFSAVLTLKTRSPKRHEKLDLLFYL